MNKYQKSKILPSMHQDRQKGINKALETQTSISKEWASQFFAKQYFKSKYKLSEKRLRTIVKTNNSVDFCPSGILPVLENKLDTIVFSLGWGKTIKEARHLIKRGKISLKKGSRNTVITNPFIRINIGDTLVIASENIEIIKNDNYIIKKKQNYVFATLIKPIKTKIYLDPKKFELYCNRWGKI